MAFDIEMIKGVYSRIAERVDAARKVVGRPLTLTEKTLYAHLDEGVATKAHSRGESYVDFRPDRVAMKMLLLRWPCFNSCKPGAKKLLSLLLFMPII
jgi:hypothetical protein